MGHKVRHFVNSLSGGTGVAASRLHAALLAQGVGSSLHYREGQSGPACSFKDTNHAGKLSRLLGNWLVSRRWSQQADDAGIFIHQRWLHKTPLSAFGDVPDIVHLHLVHRWLDLPYFLRSIPEKTRVVWSLHDLHPLTGGCTHAIGCQKYETFCGECPNLQKPSRHDRSFLQFQSKKELYDKRPIIFVANSSWTRDKASKSALLPKGASIPVIPLGVDAQAFRPVEKAAARKALQIDDKRFVIGFGCSDFNDANKGLRLLEDSLKNEAVRRNAFLLLFGSGPAHAFAAGVPSKALGRLQSAELQALFYSACDLFVVPSLIETFCLTALESMACGTPVLAFRTGGLPDLIENGETGLLESNIGSSEGLTRNIDWAIREHKTLEAMGRRARAVVEEKFTVESYARSYEELYREIV